MDGSKSSRQTLHSTELAWPNALTIDYTSQTLYWADAKLNKIERSNVDGSSRTLLTTNLILHPFGLTYHAGYLYWSDWQTDQITTTPIDDPDNVTVVIASLNTEPMGLEVVATSRQPICECSLVFSLYVEYTIVILAVEVDMLRCHCVHTQYNDSIIHWYVDVGARTN